MRSLDEIRERFNELTGPGSKDFFGFGADVLAEWIPECYKDEHKDKCPALTKENVEKRLRDYLPFAFEKALGHRGISASRSVQKISEWLWILGEGNLESFARNDRNYANYGVPVLKRIAGHFAVPLPDEIAEWEDGKPCCAGCENGCEG